MVWFFSEGWSKSQLFVDIYTVNYLSGSTLQKSLSFMVVTTSKLNNASFRKNLNGLDFWLISFAKKLFYFRMRRSFTSSCYQTITSHQ